jgi:hypothetical protein
MTEPLDLPVPDPGAQPPDAFDFGGIPEDVVSDVLGRWGYTEPEGTEAAPEQEPPEAPATTDPPAAPAEDDAPPPSPGDTPPAEPAPDVFTLPDGRQVPAAMVAQWLDQQSAPPPPAPAVDQRGLMLPPVTEEDLEMAGPAVQALLMIVNQQAQEQARIQAQLAAYGQAQQQTVQVESAQIANAAASQFAQQYNLPDHLMTTIRANVVAEDVARELAATHDPYQAVNKALERAYWSTPEARQFDFDRRAQALADADVRKRKLAGVSGPGGAAPQPSFDESTNEGRKAAAVAAVAQAMGLEQ